MKRKILLSIFTVLVLSVVFVSCKKTKKEETTIETKQTTTDPDLKIKRKFQNKKVLKRTLNRKALQIKHIDLKAKEGDEVEPATEKSETKTEVKEVKEVKKEKEKKEESEKTE